MKLSKKGAQRTVPPKGGSEKGDPGKETCLSDLQAALE